MSDDTTQAVEFAIADVGATPVVVSLQGREALSRLYALRVGFLCDEAFATTSLVGRRAALTIHVGRGPARSIHGVLAAQRIEGTARANDLFRLEVRLVPTLYRLRLRRDTRIFQDLDVLQIVGRVLTLGRVPFKVLAQGPFRPLEYCVQYRETDYDFVARLLAEHGIFYWFEQPKGPALDRSAVETLVLADHASQYPALDGDTLSFQREAESLESAQGDVYAFAWVDTLRSNVATQGGFDFVNPMVPYRVTQRAADLDLDWAPQAGDIDLESYTHHDEYLRTRVANRTARLALKQLHLRRLRGAGASYRQDLAPGLRFDLDDHPVTEFNREYVVHEVSHEVTVPEVVGLTSGRAPKPVYRNRFRCGPHDVEYLAKAPGRRLQQVSETAIVVGPAGEEIYTDEHGRIKVQFHWDREGRRDEHSSCWVRVSHAWAGAGWGTQFIPRIGMEVIVAFLEGDTDRPVVIGCLYNGMCGMPFPVPIEKSRSGIRTASLENGVGHNELSFEDRRGAEQVFLHAWRDLDEVVGNDHSRDVERDATITVGRDRAVKVKGDRVDETAGAASEVVLGDRSARVGGRESVVVGGSASTEVVGDRVTRVGGDERTVVVGGDVRTVSADRSARVLGTDTVTVGRHDAPRSFVLHVEDCTLLSSADTTEIVAQKSIALRCGSSTILMTPDSIQIVAAEVVLQGKGARMKLADDAMQALVGGGVQLVADELVLKSSGAGLKLDADATLDGATVKLKSPVSASGSSSAEPPTLTRIELRDQNGKPMASQRYKLIYADDREYIGVLDADGCAEIVVEGSPEIEFPDAREVQPC
ncbi:MAG: type VI secretion system tip protein VgrG [Deltaproteobacteria bacterium]|nr:type VI secretion system tip protein VgrG [Deltaproteobacteria bacterium]